MLRLSLSLVGWFATFFRSRHDLGLELVALLQQVGVLKRKNPGPRLGAWDRLFWVALRRFWSRWAEVLIVVKRETVVSWHRAGFASTGCVSPKPDQLWEISLPTASPPFRLKWNLW